MSSSRLHILRHRLQVDTISVLRRISYEFYVSWGVNIFLCVLRLDLDKRVAFNCVCISRRKETRKLWTICSMVTRRISKRFLFYFFHRVICLYLLIAWETWAANNQIYHTYIQQKSWCEQSNEIETIMIIFIEKVCFYCQLDFNYMVKKAD